MRGRCLGAPLRRGLCPLFARLVLGFRCPHGGAAHCGRRHTGRQRWARRLLRARRFGVEYFCQDLGQICRPTILHVVDEDPPARPLDAAVEALDPALRPTEIGLLRGYHQDGIQALDRQEAHCADARAVLSEHHLQFIDQALHLRDLHRNESE